MIKDFTWTMDGYGAKYAFSTGNALTRREAEHIFQLEPEPPKTDSLNDYILTALQENELRHFAFFLHWYEPQLNHRIDSFLQLDGTDRYNPDRFLDMKLSCMETMLQKLPDYDPDKGAEYATYIYPFLRDAMLRYRMGEEAWSISSLSAYKKIRSMAWLYNNEKDAIRVFVEQNNCDVTLAEEYLKAARSLRNRQSFFATAQDEDGEETGEDVTRDDSWNYHDILWNGMQAQAVQRAFDELNFREQTLLEKRLSICMTCGRVGPWKGRPTFEELAVMFEGSTASGAERAYRKAVEHLTELLVESGDLHAVRIRQKHITRRKKKIATADYLYQADCDGEWGEIHLDLEAGTAEIVQLADWDRMGSKPFAKRVIHFLQKCENDKLPKETLIGFEL